MASAAAVTATFGGYGKAGTDTCEADTGDTVTHCESTTITGAARSPALARNDQVRVEVEHAGNSARFVRVA